MADDGAYYTSGKIIKVIESQEKPGEAGAVMVRTDGGRDVLVNRLFTLPRFCRACWRDREKYIGRDVEIAVFPALGEAELARFGRPDDGPRITLRVDLPEGWDGV